MSLSTPAFSSADPVSRPAFGPAYAELRRTVIAAGLLKRAYGYYFFRTLVCYILLALALAIPFVLPPVFGWSALASILIGFANVQIALIGHDAGHLAVFRKTSVNWKLGQVCWSFTSGIGFWYWLDRHNRHHGHTNDVTDDPDLQGGPLLAFTEEDAASRRGWQRWLARYQAILTPLNLLIILFYAFGFRIESALYAIRSLRGGRRILELGLLSFNLVVWMVPIYFLGWRWLGIFLATNVVGSLYLALIIAPNHKGMPVWAQGAKLSFLERQVLSSRNIKPHPVSDFVFGGLNYQIEHHLFPNMPRINYSRARDLIKPFCAAHDLNYEEVNPFKSYWLVFLELRRVARASA